MKVTLLGTGTPRPDTERLGPAILVEAQGEKLLFDTGRGVTIRLHQIDIPLNKIDKVFFSHLHSDHVVGFADFWLTSWIWQRDTPLNVWGPIGTKSMMLSQESAYKEDIQIRRDLSEKLSTEGIKLIVTEIKQGIVYQKGKLKVTAFKVNHAPVKNAFGYRIDYGDKAVVISGDTTYSDNLIKYSQDVDLLIHEVAMAPLQAIKLNHRLQRIMEYHTTPEQAVHVFEKTNPKLAVFTHLLLLAGIGEEELTARTNEIYNKSFIVGKDLMTFEIGKKIQVLPRDITTSH